MDGRYTLMQSSFYYIDWSFCKGFAVWQEGVLAGLKVKRDSSEEDWLILVGLISTV